MTKHGAGRASQDALVGTNWREVYRWLVEFLTGHHGVRIEDAEQLAQEALSRLFDPTYAEYDPARHGTLREFLGSIANGMVRNRRCLPARDAAWLATAALFEEPAPSPEDCVISAEHSALALKKLSERTVRDPLVRRVIDLMVQGIHGASEQAEALGLPVEQVYRAHERVKAHVAAVLTLIGGN